LRRCVMTTLSINTFLPSKCVTTVYHRGGLVQLLV
jgi:hypothetical protein